MSRQEPVCLFLPLIRRQIPKEGSPADPPTINTSNYLGVLTYVEAFWKGYTLNPKPNGETENFFELKIWTSNMKAGLHNLWNGFLIEPRFRSGQTIKFPRGGPADPLVLNRKRFEGVLIMPSVFGRFTVRPL